LALKLAYVGGPLTFAISLVDLQPLYVILFFACPPGLLRIEKREKQAVLALAKTYTSAVADCAVVVRRSVLCLPRLCFVRPAPLLILNLIFLLLLLQSFLAISISVTIVVIVRHPLLLSGLFSTCLLPSPSLSLAPRLTTSSLLHRCDNAQT